MNNCENLKPCFKQFNSFETELCECLQPCQVKDAGMVNHGPLASQSSADMCVCVDT